MSRVPLRAGVSPPPPRRFPVAATVLLVVGCTLAASAVQVASPQERTLAQLSDEIDRLRQAGRYRDAVPLYEQAVALVEKSTSAEIDLGTLITLQCRNLFEAALFPESLTACQRALDVQEKAFGHDSRQVVSVVNNLANIRRVLGDLVGAERMLVDAVAIYERIAPGEPPLAVALNNLGSLYVALGDYERGRPLLERAIAIYKAPGRDPGVELASVLNSLAAVHQSQGNIAAALPLLEQSLEIRQRLRPPGHPDRTTALVNLGTNLQEAGELTRADALYEQAMAEYAERKALDTPDVATVSINRAMIRLLQGDYAAAEPLYQAGIDIRQRLLGASHPLTGEAFQRLAVFYEVRGQASNALDALERSTSIAERNLGLTLAAGSEQQKVRFMRTVQENTDIVLSMRRQFGADDPRWTLLAATTILQRKGRVVEAVIDSAARVRANLAEGDRATFDALAKARSTLAQIILTPGRLAPDARDARVAELSAETDRLERELALRNAAVRGELTTTIPDVRAGVPAGQVVVEYVKYLPFDPRTPDRDKRFGTARYAAFVLRADRDLVWIELGEAPPIDTAVETWRLSLRSPKDATVRQKGRALYDLLVAPLAGAVAGASHLFVVPDDVLNLIPFAALNGPDGRYLVEHQSLSYLASSRDVLGFSAAETPVRSPGAVFAAPAFGSAAAGGRAFAPLPGTAREAAAIRRLVPDVMVSTGAEATEGAVKRLQGPEVLHFATHAFVVGPGRSGPSSSRGDDRGLVFTTRVTADPAPLARAAIALAGASQVAATGEEDGLLTALETASLDLRGTRLVVISACETGIGEVRAGDGVYGFRRTLAIAGAETQVLTLWKVDDEGTADLVTAYYGGLARGQGRAEALRLAQREALARPDRSHPYYWAALVVAGNTAPVRFRGR